MWRKPGARADPVTDLVGFPTGPISRLWKMTVACEDVVLDLRAVATTSDSTNAGPSDLIDSVTHRHQSTVREDSSFYADPVRKSSTAGVSSHQYLRSQVSHPHL